ncbi:Aldo-ket-red domain-containing protein [Favolaschia claudopus]|uniref:Aldo-ket-red domain-containing protein n=1 Tax=Favolaschia claudopus TaxID=2862362 RepID=A0AAW0CTH4_9AGAR
MTRTTTFIIETTGGSPTFHIPFPISSLAALASSSTNNPHENVKFLFRNSGGRPTFHVGGAEVGVSSAEAWDYATVVEAVMGQRRKRLPLGLGTPNVRVKVEEETPGVAMVGSGKGKGKRKEKETPIDPADEDPSTLRSRLSSPAAAQRRQFTREELHALARGSLAIDSIDGIENDGRQDFLYTIDPSLPPDRPMAADEQAEWTPLWNDLLHLDRVFCGPLRAVAVDNRKVKEKTKTKISTTTTTEKSQGREKEKEEKPWPPPRVRSKLKVKENTANNSNTIANAVAGPSRPAPPVNGAAMKGNSYSREEDEFADEAEAATGGKRAGPGDVEGGPARKRSRRGDGGAGEEGEEGGRTMTTTTRDSMTAAGKVGKSSVKGQLARQALFLVTLQTLSYDTYRPILTPAERTWLSAQTEFARPPGWWRPVAWLALGERMHGEDNTSPIRPLYHGVLLEAWDRGEWRFRGHEGVGKVGVPWGEWVRGEEGKRWVAGAR